MSAYSALMPLTILERMRLAGPDESARRRTQFGTRLESSERVAVIENEVVGWSVAGPGRDEDQLDVRELYAIYTRDSTHGSGLASHLMTDVIESGPAYVWVLEQNSRARAFYAKHGFVADGVRKTLGVELNCLPEIRMARPAQ